MKRLVIVSVAAAALAFFLFRPVCVPLTNEDLQSFNVPIEQRTDKFLSDGFSEKEWPVAAM